MIRAMIRAMISGGCSGQLLPEQMRALGELGCPTAHHNFETGDRRPVAELSVPHKFLQSVNDAFTRMFDTLPSGVTAYLIGVTPYDSHRSHVLVST